MKPIVTVPNAILITPARPVTSFDKRLSRLISNMKQTLIATKNPRGVGLAAPQIGESIQVFITRPTSKAAIQIFINPSIRAATSDNKKPDEEDKKLEGCLSIPKIWGKVKRATSLTLTYQDETGASHEQEFHGFLATIIQHETDHLNGILFTRRVLEQKGKLYQTTKDDTGKEVLEEVNLK